MKKLQFMIKLNPGESIDEFKKRVYELMKSKTNHVVQGKKPTVTGTYSLSFLAAHPQTEPIIRKHLLPLVKDMKYLEQISSTLDGLAIDNMGGGIPPYETMAALRLELNTPNLIRILSEE